VADAVHHVTSSFQTLGASAANDLRLSIEVRTLFSPTRAPHCAGAQTDTMGRCTPHICGCFLSVFFLRATVSLRRVVCVDGVW
jgi:hypothetical protein